jgi:hypothetical protein
MEFSALTARALDVRRLYEAYEQRRYASLAAVDDVAVGELGAEALFPLGIAMEVNVRRRLLAVDAFDAVAGPPPPVV